MSHDGGKAAPSQQPPVARSGSGSAGNGRGAQSDGRPPAPGVKQNAQTSAPQNRGQGPTHTNGTAAGGAKSWANIAKGPSPPNGTPAAANPAKQNAPAPPAPATKSGVKLPAGMSVSSAQQRAIQFGDFDSATLLPQAVPRPAPAPPAGTSAPQPPPARVPPPEQPKPASFAAAASGNAKQEPVVAGSAQQRGYPGAPPGRAPRAPQQPVPAVMPQAAGFTPQFMMPPTVSLGGARPSGQQVMPGYMSFYPSGGFPNQYAFAPVYGTSPLQGAPMPAGGAPGAVLNMPQQPASGTSGSRPAYATQAPPPPKAAAAASAPPPRQRKILRISNPDTDEVMDLDAIKKEAIKSSIADKEKGGSLLDAVDVEPKKPVPAAEPEEPVSGVEPKEPVAVVEPQEPVAVVEPKEPVSVAIEDEEVVIKPTEAQKSAEEHISPQEQPDETSKFTEGAAASPPSLIAVDEGDAGEVAKELSPFSSAEVHIELPDDGKRRYSLDFLMDLRHFCTELPPHCEPASMKEILYDGNEVRGPPGPPERDWKSGARPPPGGQIAGVPPGMRGGRQGSRRGTIGIDSDTWERGKPLPPMPGVPFNGRGVPPGMRMSTGPLPALHKTGSAYKVGGVLTDDPEEEKAQKALKALLNKITPQNFDKITAQIVEKINERKKAKTLQGFIDQIFDKALTETTFAELYANLVASLNPALPELEDEDGNPVQFRRTLLNKCQEEFEDGVLAMKAVAEREKRQQEVAHEEQEATEEGEITGELQQKRDAARREKEIANAEVKARKRMLGNIIFVGQLYRFGVLTESVMHSCIKQLLEETQNPRPEDIECLCKLLTTVGRPMDASQRQLKQFDDDRNVTNTISTKDMMQVYFNRIEALTKNEALDSRHRFMLFDLIDLRRNSWVLRRKAEGPKKIDDIHRDAALERSRSQMLDRQQSRGGRDLPRGPSRNFDTRLDAPIRTMNRVGSQDVLGPQSFRPGGRPPPAARASPAEERTPAEEPNQAVPEQTEKTKPVDSASLPIQGVEVKVKGLLAEMFNTGDVKEASLCIKELVDAGVDMADVVDLTLTVSLESKGTVWDMLRALLKQAADDGHVGNAEFEKGARLVLNKLDDLTVDVPKAPVQIGEVLGFIIANDAADLKIIGRHIVEADAEETPEGEDTMLVSGGGALKVLGVVLQSLKAVKGAEEVCASWKASGLTVENFVPTADREKSEGIVEELKATYDIADVL